MGLTDQLRAVGALLVALTVLVVIVEGLDECSNGYSADSEGFGKFYDPKRFFPTGAPAQPQAPPASCSADTEGAQEYYIPSNLDTGHWGYFYDGLLPVLSVKSGDVVTAEMITQNANNAWEMMAEGDPAVEEIYKWDEAGPAVTTKGIAGGGEGPHWMTGPIWVCGAEPGDVVQMDILDLWPRPNPGKDNRNFGITWNGDMGWHYRAGVKTRGHSDVITVYEIVSVDGEAVYAEPQYQYKLEELEVYSPCMPLEGKFERTSSAGAATWKNPEESFGGRHVPCVDGKQKWDWMGIGGQPFVVPEDKKDYSIKGKFRSPINLHLGNAGLTPAVGAPVHTGPPLRTGGNIDDRRMGKGSTMYFPVELAGGHLWVGDAHAAMGDSELSGTGIENSVTGKFRISLHKKDALPKFLEGLDFPLLENVNEFVVHGFTHNDYLRELPYPQVSVFTYEHSKDLNRAMSVCYNNTRDFMMTAFDLTEDEAITAMSVGVDFGITQVVDGNVGIHATVPKWMFNPAEWAKSKSYLPKTITGTSWPATCTLTTST